MDSDKELEITSLLEYKDYEEIQLKLSDFNSKSNEIRNQITKLQDKLVEINEEEKDFKVKIFEDLLNKAEGFYIPPF